MKRAGPSAYTALEVICRITLLFWSSTFKLYLFDKPLCLSECARGPFPKDIDKLN